MFKWQPNWEKSIEVFVYVNKFLMDTPITKRLIISGLTTSITADDISRRLTTFGTVKALDGFGLTDGLGQPRKFGYVTLETTTGKLAKCAARFLLIESFIFCSFCLVFLSRYEFTKRINLEGSEIAFWRSKAWFQRKVCSFFFAPTSCSVAMRN